MIPNNTVHFIFELAIMKRFTLFLACLLGVLSVFAQSTRYTTIKLNMRKEANASSPVVAALPKGVSVNVPKDCDCNWILITYQGKIGYVSSRYLSNSQPLLQDQGSITSGKHAKHYTNSEGERVQSPTSYNAAPAGATALCRDGTYSFSQHHRGTCSHHGGVARWL